MIRKQVTRIHLTFEDGETMEVNLPADQGFYRQRLTYGQEEGKAQPVNTLVCHEVFWTYTEPYVPPHQRRKVTVPKIHGLT